jgi:signal transduction histidine kinase
MSWAWFKTLKSEAREFEGNTGIHCGFKTNTAKTRFDRSVGVAIFRIVQAALTNVARRACLAHLHYLDEEKKHADFWR